MKAWLQNDIGLNLIEVDCPLDERLDFILERVLS
jgi:hypothetical protein